MKVLMINGSPHEKGCTYTALEIMAEQLQKKRVDTEILWIGSRPIGGCSACGGCKNSGYCVYNDCVNICIDKLDSADGFVFASPVHYASPSGNMVSFMDRLFFAGSSKLRYKPAAVITSARRAGTTAALEVLAKYPTFNDMPLISSRYWNMVHGSTPDDVNKDEEGVQIMRELGDNMVWILSLIACGEQNGITRPTPETKIFTNYIR